MSCGRKQTTWVKPKLRVFFKVLVKNVVINVTLVGVMIQYNKLRLYVIHNNKLRINHY